MVSAPPIDIAAALAAAEKHLERYGDDETVLASFREASAIVAELLTAGRELNRADLAVHDVKLSIKAFCRARCVLYDARIRFAAALARVA